MQTVTIEDLALLIASVQKSDLENEGQDIDIRLQVWSDGQWNIHTGDSSFDQDHRGHWGSGCVDVHTIPAELARDLIDQAAESAAEWKGDSDLAAALSAAADGHDIIGEDEGDGRLVYGPVPPPLASYAYPYSVWYFNERAGTMCPDCATRARDYGDGDPDSTELIPYAHEEGPPETCEGCDATRLSEYGDPDCIVCGGEVSGLTNVGDLWECPECVNPEAPLLSWMHDNIAKARV